jgi:hypothetical protein
LAAAGPRVKSKSTKRKATDKVSAAQPFACSIVFAPWCVLLKIVHSLLLQSQGVAKAKKLQRCPLEPEMTDADDEDEVESEHMEASGDEAEKEGPAFDLTSSDQIKEFVYYNAKTEALIAVDEDVAKLLKDEVNDPRKIYVAYSVPNQKNLNHGLWYCAVVDGAADVLIDYFQQTNFKSTHLSKALHRRGYDALKKYMRDPVGLNKLRKHLVAEMSMGTVGEDLILTDFDSFFS